jgi:hypothetical protein
VVIHFFFNGNMQQFTYLIWYLKHFLKSGYQIIKKVKSNILNRNGILLFLYLILRHLFLIHFIHKKRQVQRRPRSPGAESCSADGAHVFLITECSGTITVTVCSDNMDYGRFRRKKTRKDQFDRTVCDIRTLITRLPF